MALTYRKIKNKYKKADISTIDAPQGVSKYQENPLNNIWIVWIANIEPKLRNI